MPRSPGTAALFFAIFAVALGIAVVRGWAPSIPTNAATTPLTRVVLSSDSESPAGQECLHDIRRAVGRLDLCWEARRVEGEADPAKDYYFLRVYGTYGGDEGSGVRWAIARTRLIGQPLDNVFDSWPSGTWDEPCAQTEVDLIVGEAMPEYICPRTTGWMSAADWSATLTWQCVGCLFPGRDDRSLGLYEVVGVAPGTVPGWEIYADIGD